MLKLEVSIEGVEKTQGDLKIISTLVTEKTTIFNLVPIAASLTLIAVNWASILINLVPFAVNMIQIVVIWYQLL